MKIETTSIVLLTATGVFASASFAMAQNLGPTRTGDATVAFIGSGESDLGPNDTIQFYRSVLGAGVNWANTPQFSIGADFLVGRSSYTFDTAFLGSQDVDINEFSLGIPFSFSVGQTGRAFVTPRVTFNGEDGVSFSEGSFASLIAGVGWQVSPTLFIGPGIGVAESVVADDGTSVFPILVIDWQFANNWSLTTGSGFAASRGPGLRLAYEPNSDWEISLEARLEEFEFQLNEDSPISNGAGRDTSVPVVLIAQYKPSNLLTLSGFAGVATGGALEVIDDTGRKVFDEDYDTAPLFGLAASVSF